ncbi:MAG: type II toxin-antitoxin system YafQ family toxin [Succinivibrio sp.]|nr:type II toxin-antitoxin system YafQ family toxin [Succinivibrio sp.]MDD6068426.1 type II toxin-antitoxin system YafQ family toxin [Succinivibrio sp.]MDD7287494.1 type II toxin-antitoxin system YafQ family toxin [Succinivibrio sp.]MDY3107451.1 type II toxin-antitoxin system YafQ family toxin [Succinivibrio sp.]MDY5733563.1 type II toxin-antitoxin system YafQ family toxin [Succinivibrio sp.]
MNKKLLILLTSKFKKDYKLAKKRHLDMQLLDDVIRKLSRGEQLEPQNNDHILTGNWSGYHECHIQPNWLLIYKIDNNQLILTLTRTGTHSDLF